MTAAKVLNEPRYLGNPIRTITRYWAPRLSTARTFAAMAVIFGTSTSWAQSSEEYGLADTMNLARFNCSHAYSFCRVTVAFAYDKSCQEQRTRPSRLACLPSCGVPS